MFKDNTYLPMWLIILYIDFVEIINILVNSKTWNVILYAVKTFKCDDIRIVFFNVAYNSV